MRPYFSRCSTNAALLVLMLGILSGKALAQDLTNGLSWWMYYVSDSTSLANLTIPGSHDSGALYEPVSGTAICQDLSIRNQLDIGVRYLDIRLRQYGNALLVHHGSVYQHENFDDVLGQVIGFLQTNPSETVVMEVSSEYTPANNTETYEQTFMRYVNNTAYSSYWWRHSYVPQLGQVRGKIVLLRRFTGTFAVSGGIDVTGWQDNAEFTLTDTRAVNIIVQDYYKVSASTNDHKWSAITDLFNQAVGNTSGNWYLNFTSGVRTVLGIPDIPGVANDINGRLYSYFSTDTLNNVHYGTVISDFVNKQTIQQELRTYFY
jgi:1-phosphatidylinositol phosphodiesterase